MTVPTDTRLALLEDARHRHDKWCESIDNTIGEIGRAITTIAETNRQAEARHADYQKTIDRLFYQMESAHTRIDGLDARIVEIDKHMPGLKEVRGWVVAAVLAIVVAAAVLVWNDATSQAIHVEPPKG